MSKIKLFITGNASGKSWEFDYFPDDPPLLFFLREHGLPLTYSCEGEGVCKKCKVELSTQVNSSLELLSCLTGHHELRQHITNSGRSQPNQLNIFISYL